VLGVFGCWIHNTKYNPEIICLQELNLKEDYIASLKNYNGYSKNWLVTDRASGRVAIYLKSYIPNKTINIQSEIEVVAVQINLKEKLTICNQKKN
jgi:exonuclease III